MNWNQPICEDCWNEREPDRMPVRLTEPESESCAWCGLETDSGIYLRHDPREVPYPAVES